MTWTNWDEGAPSYLGYQDCVRIDGLHDYGYCTGWTVKMCHQASKVMCQYPAGQLYTVSTRVNVQRISDQAIVKQGDGRNTET